MIDGQEGVRTETLDGVEDSRSESEGGYDPGDRECRDIWHMAYRQIPKGDLNDLIVEQGPVQRWCQEIRIFTEAATMAGRNLNRRAFDEAMSEFSGPNEYQLVSPHANVPPAP